MVVVSNGTVKYTAIPATSYTTATNGSGAFDSSAPFIDSTVYLGCDIYYADGTNYKYFDADTGTVSAWTASAGTIPANGSDKPRLIAEWRDRIVLAGIKSDPTNWFMSALGDPTDWNYGVDPIVSTMAVAGNNSTVGMCPDIITAIIPYRDDMLWFGGDHSIYQMTGDPLYGGHLDLITNITGIAWGRAWCQTPDGIVYFFGSRGGIYAIAPGGEPQRISANKTDEQLADVDVSNTVIRLVWEDRLQHVLIFITPLDNSASTHYAYDVRADAFWPMSFGDNNLNPTAVHTLDGDDPTDRVIVVGGQDGRVRAQVYGATNDDDSDNTAISSSVTMGPMMSKGNDAFKLHETQVLLGSGSNNVTFQPFIDNSAETAFNSTALWSYTVSAGRNASIRRSGFGNSAYFKLSNSTASETWSLETMRVAMRQAGRSAQRRL